MTAVPDIPRLYTALAECLATLLYARQLAPRYSARRSTLNSLIWMAGLAVFMQLTGSVPLMLWLPCMVAAIGSMYLFLWRTCETTPLEAGYYCARAFILAELAASVEWQLHCALWPQRSGRDPLAVLLLVLVYGALFAAVYWMEKRRSTQPAKLHITPLGMLMAVIMAITVFAVSNLSFVNNNEATMSIRYIRTLVDGLVSDQLAVYLEEHPVVARTILDKALTANRAREAARKARESIRRKTALGGAAMPDKLRDCNENNPELTEIYIVEGDSAGGSATQGRDSRFQAILPLWGKMLNVEKARADKVYGNDKLQPVITALGAGIGEEFDLNKLRYHKIIIMADADVDGAHIRTLLLTFFFRFMRPLIEEGYVYSAVPPLYKLTRGKQQRVAYTDEERDAISSEMRDGNPNVKIDINRYKGLGEMNPHELWETTMDPEKRTLRRITLDDAVKADETFTVLMGEKVEPRKEFIEKNAKYAVNLDY